MTRRVAIIIPTLNEEATIGRLLSQFARESSLLVAQIIVADGGSSDATCAIVHKAQRLNPRIRLIHNPKRVQAAGINYAAALADSSVNTFIRADAHNDYPDDYVSAVVGAFDETGADMIAVRLHTRGDTPLQQAIAAAANSRAGSGGSAHRMGGFSGFVDHGHHAGMDRAMFDRVGGYDEDFVANEDAEFDVRVRAIGGRIWLAGAIALGYHPRKSLAALGVQYWRYGAGRAQNWAKHHERLRLRQLAPVFIVISCAGAFVLSPVMPGILTIPVAYLAGLILATLVLVWRNPGWSTLLAAPALLVMHCAWGLGFIWKQLEYTVAQLSLRSGVKINGLRQPKRPTQ